MISKIGPLSSWRTLPANQFLSTQAAAIRQSLAATALLDEPRWRAVLAGDAAAAAGITVRSMPVKRITWRTDMMMSALCPCALHSADAALVLGHILKQLGTFDPAAKRCAASWFGHQLTSLGHEARPDRTASFGRSVRGRPSPRWDHHGHQAGTEGGRS